MDFGILMDPGIVTGFQTLSQPLTSVLTQGEFLDTMPWYFLLLSLVTFGLHPRYGVRLTTLFGLNVGINEAAKLACHLPRPYWISETVRAVSAHPSFGFPSGAAMSGMVMYGYIALIVRRYWAIILCGILLLLTSFVRIFAGIHFLLDILGGWLIGIVLLLVFMYAGPGVEGFVSGLSRPARMAFFAVIAAIPILVVVPAYLILGSWELPAAWLELARQQTGAAINPASIRFAYGASGIIFGGLFGYEFLRSRGGWTPPEGWQRKTVVVVLGTLSVLLLNMAVPLLWKSLGISVVIPPLSVFLNMAMVTFWLMAGVPCIAAKAGFTGS